MTKKLDQFSKNENQSFADKLAPYLLNHIADEWKDVLNTAPKEYSGNKEFFDRLYQQCRLICNIKSAQIANSNICKFAKAYLDFYHSSISIKITGIRARKARETKVNVKIDKCDFKIGNEQIWSEKIDRKIEHSEVNIKLDSTITMKPWERTSVWIKGHIGFRQNNGNTYFNPQGKIHLAEVEDEFDCVPEARLHGFDYLHIKFKIISGKGFPDLLNEIFGTNTPSRNVIRNTF